MSIPNRLPPRNLTPPPPIPILGPRSSGPSILAWIQEWQFHRAISISPETLQSITWTSTQLSTRSAKNLHTDLITWGFSASEAWVLVADILAGMGRDQDRMIWEGDERSEEIARFLGKAVTVVAMLAIIFSGALGKE